MLSTHCLAQAEIDSASAGFARIDAHVDLDGDTPEALALLDEGIFGTGMHHDACNSSISKKLFHWGHDWVDLCIIIANPWWAKGKVFALPICMRLYRNKQGLVKGKNKVKTKRDASREKAASKKAKQAAVAQKTPPPKLKLYTRKPKNQIKHGPN